MTVWKHILIMKNNKTVVVWVVIGIVLLGGLFMWPKFSNPYRGDIKAWERAGVDCLPSHTRAALHIHPHLTITVDGTQEDIPQNTGIVRGCMAELHTHEGDGTIHAESVLAAKEFTLGQFLLIYKKPYEREGYTVSMKVDGVESQEGEDLVLRDKQDVVLEYTQGGDQ